MTAVDFPNSPTVGDIYTTGDISRKWDGTTWSIIATTITGPTGATGPQILSATSPILWDSSGRILSFAGLNSILPTQTSNANKFLKTDGSNTSWGDAAVSITNDTTTATALYPLFTASTSGTITSANVTSSKLKYTPSTGLLETSAITTTGALTIGGDLTINGTTTTLNTNTLTVDDKNIEMGSVIVIASTTGTISATTTTTTVTGIASTTGFIPGMALTKISGTGAFGGATTVTSVDSATQITITSTTTNTIGSITFSATGATDVTANGGGITLKGATDKTLQWTSTGSNWTSSENLDLVSTKVYKINNTEILSATKVLGITPTINATGFTLSGGTTAVAVTFAGGSAYTLSGTNGTTNTFPTAGGTLLSTTTGVTTFSGGTTGLTPASGTSGAITLAGTLATANGGTNLTGFTAANNAIYSTSSTALTAGTLPVLAGGTGVTTSTGSGANVLGTSPIITTPQLQLETTARTTDGSLYWDSTYDILKAGDGTSAVSFFPLNINATAKTAAYTLTTTDYNTLVQMNGAFAFTINTTLSAAPVGTQINLLALTAGVSVTVTGITVYYTPGLKLRAQYSTATLICLASNVWLLTGDLSA